MRKTALSLKFPAGGLSERYGYQAQPPYTSPRLSNVRPTDVMEDRARGGSRPGLCRQYSAQLGRHEIAFTVKTISAAANTTITANEPLFTRNMVGKSIIFDDSYDHAVNWTGCHTPHPIITWNSTTQVVVAGDITGDHSVGDPFHVRMGATYHGGSNTILTLGSGTVTCRGATATLVSMKSANSVSPNWQGCYLTFDHGSSYSILEVYLGYFVYLSGDATGESETDSWYVADAVGGPVSTMHTFRENTSTGWETFRELMDRGYISSAEGYEDLDKTPWAELNATGVSDAVDLSVAYEGVPGQGRQVPVSRGGTSDSLLASVADAFSPALDEAHAHTVALKLYPLVRWDSTANGGLGGFLPRLFDGKHHIYLKMGVANPATAPDLTTGDGLEVEWEYDYDNEQYVVKLYKYIAGVKTQVSDTTEGTVALTNEECAPTWLQVHCTKLADATSSNDIYTVKIDFRGTTILTEQVTVTQASNQLEGVRVGFGLTGDGAYASEFHCHYYASSGNQLNPDQLIAISNGYLYHQGFGGVLEPVTTDTTFANDRMLMAAEYGGKVYIADYDDDIIDSGTDGKITAVHTYDDAGGQDWSALGIDYYQHVLVISDGSSANEGAWKIELAAAAELTTHSFLDHDGTALSFSGTPTDLTYQIVRGPKVYDPSVTYTGAVPDADGAHDPVYPLLSDSAAGQPDSTIPTRCSIVVRYRGRLCWAGDLSTPLAFYMSRVGNPHDYDYSQTDAEAAVGGAATYPGVIAAPITALIPVADDYLLIACAAEMWIMRGDPGYGGQLDQLSPAIGCVDRMAWCLTPENVLYFMGYDGLYKLARGAQTSPIPVSHNVIPTLLRGITNRSHTILMRYDPEAIGIHIYIVPADPGSAKHYWMDTRTETIWPVDLVWEHHPFSLSVQSLADEDYHRMVLLGCRDGYIRRFNADSVDDDGETFTSQVGYGPFLLANNDQYDGIIRQIKAGLDLSSADVTLNVYVGDSHESVLQQTSPFWTTTLSAGRSYTGRPMARGVSCLLELTSTSRWAIEMVSAVFESRGIHRRL